MKKTILIIDDNPNDTFLMLEALDEITKKYEVKIFNDSEKALEYLNSKNSNENFIIPSLILLDVKMPKINGFEILKTIKSNNALKFIPVVMFSSSKEKSDLEKCYMLGANAFVVKPTNFDEFINTLKSIGNFWLEINELPLSYN
ncbi:response regulator [Rosettibacter firmus]|uniref:response regulator n=1 Tax=Rosettibacter firmus TaxID=3111522 RepID=UPI00336C07CF